MSNAERRPYVPVPREIKLDKAKEYKAKKKAYDEKNKVAGEVSDVPDAKLAGKSMSIIGYEKAVEKMNKKNSPYMAMADYLAKVEAYNKNKKVAVGPADEESGKSKSEVEADDKNQSGEEKAPCVAKAEKRKTEYNENVDVYNKKVAVEPVDDEESDKSKYKVEADEAQSGEEEDLNDD